MSDLEKCGRDGCNPVQQSRGQMRPEDYHMLFARYHAVTEMFDKYGIYLDVRKFYEDVFNIENDPNSADDVRVSCSKCGKATPWMRRDIEEYRRHGDGDYRRYTTMRDGNLELVHQRWNEGIK